MSDIIQLDPSLIDPPIFDSRVARKLEDVDAMAASIKTTGQLQPVTVEAVSGENGTTRYRADFGFTRILACRKLGIAVDAIVVKPMAENDQVLANGIENARRKELTNYELARLFSTLRNKGHKLDQIAAATGYSKPHISNLTALFELLPPEVLDDWRNEEPTFVAQDVRPMLTKEVEGKKIARPPEEILELYNGRKAALAASVAEDEADEEDKDEGDEDDDKTPPDRPVKQPPFKVEVARYQTLRRALVKAGAPKIAVDAVAYLVGNVDKIRGLNLGTPETKKVKGDK
jgi:ParB/RepB/Spo0J family partition protein